MAKMKEHPRYNVVSIRITDEERERLEQMTSLHRTSISALLREALQLRLAIQGRCII